MRLLAKSWILVLAALVAAAAYAAPDDGSPDKLTTKVSAGAVGRLSVTDMSLRAVAVQTQAKEDNRHVLHLQAIAHKQKDVIKLNCINDKLVQLKAQSNILDGIDSSLTGALTGNNDERFVLFAELSTAAENVKHLREEADVCAGEPELFKKDSRNEVTRPLIPDDPATGDPFTNGVEAPGYASPFR